MIRQRQHFLLFKSRKSTIFDLLPRVILNLVFVFFNPRFQNFNRPLKPFNNRFNHWNKIAVIQVSRILDLILNRLNDNVTRNKFLSLPLNEAREVFIPRSKITFPWLKSWGIPLNRGWKECIPWSVFRQRSSPINIKKHRFE
jgi:hypothetical protein